MAVKTKKAKREKLKLLVSMFVPEGGKARDVINRIKDQLNSAFIDPVTVRKAPAPAPKA